MTKDENTEFLRGLLETEKFHEEYNKKYVVAFDNKIYSFDKSEEMQFWLDINDRNKEGVIVYVIQDEFSMIGLLTNTTRPAVRVN